MAEDNGKIPTAGDPYVGLEALHKFDDTIIACMALNDQIAPKTRTIKMNEIQSAAAQIIPSGISLALSIRELVREAYLYGALVLERPLAERAITILYLHEFPDNLKLWKNGWKHRERPTLAKMFEKIDGGSFPGCGSKLTCAMNSLIHGDPDSAMWNLVAASDGSIGHAIGRIMNRPDLCDRVCHGAANWLAILISMSCAIFLEKQQNG